MAHSSGGGSSGGGCHGSGSGGSGNHRNSHGFHHAPFPGSHRYAYLDRYGRRRYIYSQRSPAQYSTSFFWYTVAMSVILMIGSGVLKMGFLIPQRLDNPDSQIIIDDRLGVIRDQDQLIEDLTGFYEKTGVTPAVQTISQQDWSEHNSSLEIYAMGEYYKLFQDEVHWLIVYSAPVDGNGKPDLSQWSFEGVIGDDTGDSVHDPLCAVFTRRVYSKLTFDSTPEEAISSGFDRVLEERKPAFYARDMMGSQAFITFAIHWFIVLMFPGRALIIYYQAKVKYKNAVLDE